MGKVKLTTGAAKQADPETTPAQSSFAALKPEILRDMEEPFKRAKAAGGWLCMLELVGIATLYDTYGKQVYKALEQHTARALQQHLGTNVSLYKITLGKFIFMSGAVDRQALAANLRAFLDDVSVLSKDIAGAQLVLAVRMGVANTKDIDLDAAIIKGYAALSYAQARHQEHKMAFYEDIGANQIEAINNMRIAAYLMNAIDEERVMLAFQPVVESKTGRIDKYEGLLRIRNEDGHLISAGPFIGAAELLGCIHKVDTMVLELVIQELKKNPEIRLGMNISNMSVDNREWIKKAKSLLHDEQISQRLTIEITETGNHYSLDKMAYLVDMLKSLGCSVAIDDFGAGYTSFKQLKLLHADYIKIDGAFIRNIVDDEDSRLFVSTLITFAKSFGVKSVAEFVENGEIAKVLLELGVDYMQGNYFSAAINYRPWVEGDQDRTTVTPLKSS